MAVRKQLDPSCEWMDLHALEQYACVSERTLREWIHREVGSLPAVRVGNKMLVNRAVFDRWLNSHPVIPAGTVDLERIADEVLNEVSGRH